MGFIMSHKFCFIDFEYNNSQAQILTLICCSMHITGKGITSYWLHNDLEEQEQLKNDLLELKDDGYIFVAHYVPAEGHAFISLGLDPLDFKWIDTRSEYKCVLNHSDIMYGRHLIGGRVVYTQRPDYFETDKVNNSKPEATLSSMVYQMNKKKVIDTDHKDEMRDLILSAPARFTAGQAEDIISYCESDVRDLEACLSAIVKKYHSMLGAKPKMKPLLLNEMLLRGQFGADCAWMYSRGYPIDIEATTNFSESVEDILSDIARDINRQFPDIKPFRYDPKDERFKTNTKHIKGWIGDSQYKDKWLLTPGKSYSLSLDAFGKHFKFSHNYPEGNFGAQILRYLKTKQSMNGFRKSLNGKKSFWDNVGPDGRVRPFLNPFGSQSSRSQPSATGFIPLKAAWMRSLIVPPPGRAMCELDYGSQEYLVAALLAKDKKMIDSYKTGDVYLAFAKLSKMVPQNATKKTHPKERQAAKAAVLAISYGMTGKGLAETLKQQTGDDWSVDDAQKMIDDFHTIYSYYTDWKAEIQNFYSTYGFLKLKDGWYMWGENDNFRSVGNFPVQGAGADIMRRACNLAHKNGLDVTYPLHDAVYIEYDAYDFESIDILENCLRQAFTDYFDDDIKDEANLIRIDGTTWSKDYKNETIITPKGFEIGTETIHIDERTVEAYEQFSPYFKREKIWDIL